MRQQLRQLARHQKSVANHLARLIIRLKAGTFRSLV